MSVKTCCGFSPVKMMADKLYSKSANEPTFKSKDKRVCKYSLELDAATPGAKTAKAIATALLAVFGIIEIFAKFALTPAVLLVGTVAELLAKQCKPYKGMYTKEFLLSLRSTSETIVNLLSAAYTPKPTTPPAAPSGTASTGVTGAGIFGSTVSNV